MPRDIPIESLNKIAQRTGLEPVNVIRIQWVKHGGYFYYADRRIPGNHVIQGKLIDLSDIEAVLNIDKSGSSTSLSITLNDSDGNIKILFDHYDIHNRPAVVYQWFSDISTNYMFSIFEGVIATPIVWDEGTRTVKFDIITKLEDREVGFSVEDGDFTNIPQLILGKSWPLVFGTVQDIPTLQMDDMPSGTTKIPLGIPDSNINRQTNYLDSKASEQAGKATCLSLRAAELLFQAMQNNDDQLKRRGQALQRQAMGMLNQVNNKIAPESNRLKAINSSQKGYDATVIPVINGHKFVQGTVIEIEINSAHFVGQFQGDNFVVAFRRSPTDAIHRQPNNPFPQNPNNQYDLVIQNTQEQSDNDLANLLEGGGFVEQQIADQAAAEEAAYWACEPPYFIQLSNLPQNQKGDGIDNHKEGEFWYAQAGSAVNVGESYPIRYILSITPNTEVLWLSGRRTVNGLKVITPIPPDYYTISKLELGSITAVIATFSQPLSTILDADWENDIFATLRSPIGPNVVDILIWLIQTYTEFGIDFESFNYVRTKLEKYPANFAILNKKNVVDTLKEIAWQSRCSIWIANDKFYIKYLPEQTNPVDDLNENDIEQSTLEVSCTSSDDLVTKFVANWKSSYSQQEDNKVILRYNINKYGTHEQTFDFYIYNSVELVLKSATFWLMRMANIWKVVKCKAFLTKLKLETLDSVLLNFINPFVATTNIIGIVEKATFNSGDFSIDMEVWTPVRLGEMIAYPFAYPAGISVTYLWPTHDDIAGGFTGDTAQQVDAVGDLNTTSQGGGISPQKSGGSRTNQQHLSDNYDSPQTNNLPPILETVIGTNPFTGRTATGTGGANNPNNAQRGTTQRRPGYDYTFRQVNERGVIPEQPTGTSSFIAVVKSGSANSYTVWGYPAGLAKPKVDYNQVQVPTVIQTETIPAETWGILLRTQGGNYIFVPAGLWVEG